MALINDYVITDFSDFSSSPWSFIQLIPTPRRSIKQLRAFDGWRCIVSVCIIATCRMQLSRLNQTLIESQLIKLPSQILLRGNPISSNGFFLRAPILKKKLKLEKKVYFCS